MDNSITNSTDSSTPTAQDNSPNDLDVQSRIVAMFCDGYPTKDVAHALGLTLSQVNTAFHDIRVKAFLPQERKTYQACAEDVKANLARYYRLLESQGELATRYVASQIKFSF